MSLRSVALIGVSAGLALALTGCSSASQKVEEAASSAAAVVSQKASEVASAAASVASEAASAASSAASEVASAASSAASEAASAASEAASAAASKVGATYTMDDVAAHSKASDCWVAINGMVYDLTKWEDQHPGGADKITALCGTDATAAFSGQHDSAPKPNAALAGFMIGTLS